MKKAIIITITIAALIVLGVFIYLKKRKLADFEPVIKDKLQSLVIKATDSLYRLEFDTLDADVLSSRLTVVNARLLPDSTVITKMKAAGTLPPNIFKVSLDTLLVTGIDLNDFISNKKIDLDTLYINQPYVEIFHMGQHAPVKDSTTIQGLYDKMAKQLNRLSIKKLFVKNMHMEHENNAGGKTGKKIALDNVNVFFDDILMDSTTAHDYSRFLFAKNAVASLATMRIPTADSLYYLVVDSVSLNAVHNSANIGRFTVQPRYSRAEFEHRISRQKDLYHLIINNIHLQNINWGHILTGEAFTADTIAMNGGTLDIYTDRRLPTPPSKLGKYPHQLLMKDSTPVSIRAITLRDFDISYSELNPNSGKTGTITFSNAHGVVTNIANTKSSIAQNDVMKIKAEAIFLHKANVTATFMFNLAKAKQGVFSVDAAMAGMDATQLNAVAEPLGRFSIQQGKIESLTTHISGDNYNAKGSITFLYSNLKIAVLKKDPADTMQFKKRGLLSFIANTFVIKNANPTPGGDVRTLPCSHKRDITKSFFNLVWKTAEDGIKKTAGYNK
ncbi:MAG TPA: hypothetical protein VG738_15485 [Chitinophagaceae bacterium]|nr:hypothetical protein [Chitinophagaceae bacterium]